MKKRIVWLWFFVSIWGAWMTIQTYASTILSSPQELTLIAQLGGVEGQPLADVSSVFTQGELAFALDSQALVVIDIQNPEQPHVLSQLPRPEREDATFTKVRLTGMGPWVYFSQGKIVYVVDMRNPQRPAIYKQIPFDGFVEDIVAMPDGLYILADHRLFGVDLVGDETPRAILDNGGAWLAIRDLQGRRVAFLGGENVGQVDYRLSIVDISDENQPQTLSQVVTRWTGEIVVRGDRLYLADGAIFDIADLTQPRLAGLFEPSKTDRIDVMGRHLYLDSGAILDVSDLSYVRRLAQPAHEVPGRDIMALNELALVAAGRHGVLIYRYLPRTVFYQRWEAETEPITAPMDIGEEPEACGGRYVFSPQAWSDGSVEFVFTSPSTENYFIWARVQGQDWHRNSFWVTINDGDPIHFEIRPPDGQWHWIQVYPEYEAKQSFAMKEGPNVIRFLGREADSRIDALYISNHPLLHPDDDKPCSFPLTPTPTPSPTATPLTPTTTPTPTPLPAPAAFGVFPMGAFGGHALGGSGQIATAQGTMVYLGRDDRLILVDAGNPYQFQILGESDPLPGRIQSLAIHSQHIFAQANGLVVMDVSNPAHPRQVAYLPGLSGEVRIVGDRLYVLNQRHWSLFDISQPDAPRLLGQVMAPDPYEEVDFDGSLAFARTGWRLSIYDLNDPTQLQLAGVYYPPLNERIDEIAVQLPWLYLYTSLPGSDPQTMELRIRVLDVSDPAHPVEKGVHLHRVSRDYVRYQGLTAAGDDLFLGVEYLPERSTTTTSALWQFDIRDPNAPTLVLQKRTLDNVKPFLAANSRVYANPASIQIYQRPDLERLPLDPRTRTFGGERIGKRIGGLGSDIFLWDGDFIRMVDNHAPAAPVEKAVPLASNLNYRLQDVAFSDDRAVIVYLDRQTGVQFACLFQLTELANPPETPAEPWCPYPLPIFDERNHPLATLAQSKGYVFLAVDTGNAIATDVVDARNLGQMAIVSSTNLNPVDVAVLDCCQDEPYAAWAINVDGQSSIRIASLAHPDVAVGDLTLTAPIRKIAISGALLLALTDNDLRLVDISLLNHPRMIGVYAFSNVAGKAHVLVQRNGRAYVGIGRQLRVVDISDPAHPAEVGLYVAPDAILDLNITYPIISLAVDEAGMMNVIERIGPSLYLPLLVR